MMEHLQAAGKLIGEAVRPVVDATAYALTFFAGATHMVHRRDDDTEERTKMDWVKIAMAIIVALGSQIITGVVAGYFGAQTAIAVHAQRLNDHEKRMDRIDSRVERIVERAQR